MRRRLRTAARALRDFLRGFTGIAWLPPEARETQRERERERPFCC